MEIIPVFHNSFLSNGLASNKKPFAKLKQVLVFFSVRMIKWDPISLVSSYSFSYPLLEPNEILSDFWTFPSATTFPMGSTGHQHHLIFILGRHNYKYMHTEREPLIKNGRHRPLVLPVFWTGITIFCLGGKTWTSGDSFTVQNTGFSSLLPARSKDSYKTFFPDSLFE